MAPISSVLPASGTRIPSPFKLPFCAKTLLAAKKQAVEKLTLRSRSDVFMHSPLLPIIFPSCGELLLTSPYALAPAKAQMVQQRECQPASDFWNRLAVNIINSLLLFHSQARFKEVVKDSDGIPFPLGALEPAFLPCVLYKSLFANHIKYISRSVT